MRIAELVGASLTAFMLLMPALAIFRHLGAGLRLTERFLLSLALAPLALALPALPLALLGRLPVDWCLWQSEFLWAVAALWPRSRAAPEGPAEPLPERGHGFPSLAALGTAGGAALLVGGVAFSSPYVRMWSDAWFHAGATIEVSLRGLPPQDPSFAGIPFYHAWVYPFVLALLGSASKLSPFNQMALLNVWAAAVTVLAVAQLAYRAFGRGAAIWAGAIAVLGLDPFGWAFWIARGAAGSGGLSSMIGQLGTSDGALAALSHRFPPGHVSLLNRFWTGTALTPAIALGAATAWSAVRGLERPGRAAWLRTLLLALALFAVHPAYAAFAVAAIGVGLVWAAWPPGRRGAALALLVALGLAGVAAVPYVRACGVPGASPPVRLGFHLPNLWSLLLAAGPWWLVAAPVLAGAARGAVPGRFALAAVAAAVGLALLAVRPQADTDQLFDLAWVLLVPLAAAGVTWWGDRLRLPWIGRLTLLTALMLPTPGLYAVGTASDPRSPGVLIRGDTPAARGLPLVTPEEAEAYRFVRDRLSSDAVVIEKPRPTVNEPIPVLAERRVFCGSLDASLAGRFGEGRPRSHALHALMEEFEVRRGIQQALFGDGELEETQRIYLAGFSAPLYLLVRRSEVADDVWHGFLRRPEWVGTFANREVRLYRFQGRVQ